MLDIADRLCRWSERGEAFAVATVTAVAGSAPRQPGAALAVDGAGKAVGSVSGGCVEAAVYELCRQVLAEGGTVVQRFGYSAADAFAVGLTCGGSIEVLVERIDPTARPEITTALAAAVKRERLALVRTVEGPPAMQGRALLLLGAGEAVAGAIGPVHFDRGLRRQAHRLLDMGTTATFTTAHGGHEVTVLVETCVPPPRMLLFGATDVTVALADTGTFLGYRVTVCDARPVFATTARFPRADEVVVDWPHRYLGATEVDARTVICVLTHDAKFDVPLLEGALRLPVAYIGAMGSRRTHLERLERLRAIGLTETQLARLRSPIGLDLGAQTPQETALSVAAEIIACRYAGSGMPLTRGSGPIHRDAVERRCA